MLATCKEGAIYLTSLILDGVHDACEVSSNVVLRRIVFLWIFDGSRASLPTMRKRHSGLKSKITQSYRRDHELGSNVGNSRKKETGSCFSVIGGFKHYVLV